MSETPACECPTDNYCPKCHPCWYAIWRAKQRVCCCEASPPEFGGNLPDRECPIHGERPIPPTAPTAKPSAEEGQG